VDLSARTDVPLAAGDAVFFHSLTVHGSGPNPSPFPRHTALYAYFPPSVRYVPGEEGPAQRTFPVVSGLDGKSALTLTADSKVL
jgi:ectoine hydroxylase-related dioxygenase (phytanoyl-CoA dioxygenase family)